ncbi:hypothetical protein N1031_18670 [Herbiconiux moechotypicola]|nr:hypothetical protein [Herbiconiux moechotypicola]MCS5731783.1 hypothetical protein [Herbiconiux moechotypicola]
MRRVRPTSAAVTALVGLVVAALLAGCVAVTPTWWNPGGGGGGVVTEQQLTAAGIEIVDDETAVTTETIPTAYTVTRIQAERMLAEVRAGAGRTGAEIDAMVPLDPTLPRMSYLLAAYLSADDLPGDPAGQRVARTLYPGDTDWTHPEVIVFPMAVIALFEQDLMTAALAEGSFEAETPAAEGMGLGPAAITPAVAPALAPAVIDSPCSTVTAFISSTIQSLFDVLRVIPREITKISELGIFGVLLGALVESAIGLAQGVVEGLVAVVTGPVLNALRVGLSGLGTASLVLSYFTNERLVVKVTPADHTSFGIQPAPGNTGTFTASTLSLTKDWPSALADCAKVSGASIPELIRAGDAAEWTLTQGVTLISLDGTQSTVTNDKTAIMSFVTATEDAETAKGPEITEAARVTVKVPRKEVGDFLDLAAKQVETVKADILAKVPDLFKNTASTVLDAAIDPVVSSLRSSLEGAAGEVGMLNLKGDGTVWVTHHQPKEPDPPAAPEEPVEPGDGDGDFCTQFSEQAAIGAASLPSAGDPFSWAASFAAGLHSITAEPPAELAGDFSTVVQFYDIAARSSFSDAQELADFVASHDIDNARVRLWAACDAPQIDGF